MFAELTGPKSAKNVVFATTMWDILGSKINSGKKREQGLIEEYWKAMIHRGATVERFLNDSDSAWSIVNNIVGRNHPKAVLLFQEERVDQRKQFTKTSVGQALYLDLDRLIQKQNEEVEDSTSGSSGSVTHGAQYSE